MDVTSPDTQFRGKDASSQSPGSSRYQLPPEARHDLGKAALLSPGSPHPCKDLKPFDLPKMRCFKETLKMVSDTNRKKPLV